MLSNPIQKTVLTKLKDEAKAVLKENFIGAYVHGSLATGDSVDWSDLDVMIVIKEDISSEKIEPLQKLHHKLYKTLEIRHTNFLCNIVLSSTTLPTYRYYCF